MTAQRYAQILQEYGITPFHFPTDEQLKDMTEEQAHKSMQIIRKVFEEAFGKKKREMQK